MAALLVEDHGAVRLLTMNRPDRHNALNSELTQALHDAVYAAEASDSVHAIVLAGSGKSFCAGADVTEFASLAPADPLAVNRRADLTTALHLSFSQISKPVIGAVWGNALGGGAGLALACDMVAIAEDARFGYPELQHGIVAAVVLANLVRQVGRKQAFELVALARPIDGRQAVQSGLANRCASREEVLPLALEWAQTLAQWNPLAMSTTKRTFHRVSELPLKQALEVGRDANVMMRGFRQAATEPKP